MNRPYPTYSTASRTRRFDDYDETDVVDYDDGYSDYPDYRDYEDSEVRGRHDDDFHDDETFEDVYQYVDPIDRRWMWVAGAAGAVLLVAVICTIVILGGGDSGSVSATVSPPAATTPITTPAATTPAAPARTPAMAAPTTPLAPETVTTVAPSPSALAAPPAAPAPPVAAAIPPAGAPNTVTYRVTGTRPLIDLVTVIYTDAQGALQTDVNVALPWTKAVTLDPGVSLGSVTATSVTGQLNCTIADWRGAVVAAQTNNSMITTCTR